MLLRHISSFSLVAMKKYMRGWLDIESPILVLCFLSMTTVNFGFVRSLDIF